LPPEIGGFHWVAAILAGVVEVVCALTHLRESISIWPSSSNRFASGIVFLTRAKGFVWALVHNLRRQRPQKEKVMSISATREEAVQNHLLAGASDEELARLLPNLQPLNLSLGQVLYESGEKMDYV
jgi:hypothetical protein